MADLADASDDGDLASAIAATAGGDPNPVTSAPAPVGQTQAQQPAPQKLQVGQGNVPAPSYAIRANTNQLVPDNDISSAIQQSAQARQTASQGLADATQGVTDLSTALGARTKQFNDTIDGVSQDYSSHLQEAAKLSGIPKGIGRILGLIDPSLSPDYHRALAQGDLNKIQTESSKFTADSEATKAAISARITGADLGLKNAQLASEAVQQGLASRGQSIEAARTNQGAAELAIAQQRAGYELQVQNANRLSLDQVQTELQNPDSKIPKGILQEALNQKVQQQSIMTQAQLAIQQNNFQMASGLATRYLNVLDPQTLQDMAAKAKGAGGAYNVQDPSTGKTLFTARIDDIQKAYDTSVQRDQALTNAHVTNIYNQEAASAQSGVIGAKLNGLQVAGALDPATKQASDSIIGSISGLNAKLKGATDAEKPGLMAAIQDQLNTVQKLAEDRAKAYIDAAPNEDIKAARTDYVQNNGRFSSNKAAAAALTESLGGQVQGVFGTIMQPFLQQVADRRNNLTLPMKGMSGSVDKAGIQSGNLSYMGAHAEDPTSSIQQTAQTYANTFHQKLWDMYAGTMLANASTGKAEDVLPGFAAAIRGQNIMDRNGLLDPNHVFQAAEIASLKQAAASPNNANPDYTTALKNYMLDPKNVQNYVNSIQSNPNLSIEDKAAIKLFTNNNPEFFLGAKANMGVNNIYSGTKTMFANQPPALSSQDYGTNASPQNALKQMIQQTKGFK